MYLIYKRQEDLRAFLSFYINVIDCVAFFDYIFREGVGGGGGGGEEDFFYKVCMQLITKMCSLFTMGKLSSIFWSDS